MFRVILFIAGIILLIIGIFSIIIYSNLFTFYYDFLEYLFFLCTHKECFCFLIGLLIVSISIFRKGNQLYDIYI